MSQHWINPEKLRFYIHVDVYVLIFISFLLTVAFYKFFLKKISDRRHNQLRERFKVTIYYFLISVALSTLFWTINYHYEGKELYHRSMNLLGFISLLAGTVVVIRIAQIALYLYLFFMNMSQGVPKLIVNIFTLVLSIGVFFWLASELFGIKVAPLLATSAVFSIVLGLALQDTLGNVFSGLAIQLERPFHIGDWIEINSSSEIWVGQVQEITWRATILSGFSDEAILVPNKIMGSAQITVRSTFQRPSRVGHIFRLKFNVHPPTAKKVMLEALSKVPNILKDPEARVLMLELNESSINFKLLYSIEDHGMQYRIGDQVIQEVLEAFQLNQIPLAYPVITLNQVSKNE